MIIKNNKLFLCTYAHKLYRSVLLKKNRQKIDFIRIYNFLILIIRDFRQNKSILLDNIHMINLRLCCKLVLSDYCI